MIGMLLNGPSAEVVLGREGRDQDIKSIEQSVRGRGAEALGRLERRDRTNGDLVAEGVLDPVTVSRSAPQSAVSTAGMLLTTEALAVRRPREPETPSCKAKHSSRLSFGATREKTCSFARRQHLVGRRRRGHRTRTGAATVIARIIAGGFYLRILGGMKIARRTAPYRRVEGRICAPLM